MISGMASRSAVSRSLARMYLLMVIPYLTGIFWEVSAQMRAGVSGRPGLGTLISMTWRRNSLGEKMPGSSTTGSPSTYPRRVTKALRSGSAMVFDMVGYPRSIPKTARAVCRGFRQVVTFI